MIFGMTFILVSNYLCTLCQSRIEYFDAASWIKTCRSVFFFSDIAFITVIFPWNFFTDCFHFFSLRRFYRIVCFYTVVTLFTNYMKGEKALVGCCFLANRVWRKLFLQTSNKHHYIFTRPAIQKCSHTVLCILKDKYHQWPADKVTFWVAMRTEIICIYHAQTFVINCLIFPWLPFANC